MSKKQESAEKHDRIVIHFDYDCFYASVIENENPTLKSLPLAIQQKQIVVTCNYEARRRGLYKLQLITEAKRICPEVVIIVGEDLTRFRNASKELYNFLNESTWSHKAERLGFDEVWLDCTDMVEYNLNLLNEHDLEHSYFYLDRDDPTVGFEFDATRSYGPTYPAGSTTGPKHRRLILASHVARQLRHELERQKGYTATVGIASNKTLSKLVGNVNKPRNQTTLVPLEIRGSNSSALEFMDTHDIGKVPGIGFKLSHKIRERVLGRPPGHDVGLVYGGTKEHVTVRDVRLYAGMGPQLLEQILSGPGSQKGIGGKVWDLLHGIDDTEVAGAKRVPSQISQEDSYMKYLHTFEDVKFQLRLLGKRLIERMHIDLTEEDNFELDKHPGRWLAHPRTLRLSTRPRPAANPDGSRPRTFHRISRSAPMPTFVFSLTENVDSLADKLVEEALVPMFRKLHPEKSGWNLSLINVAVTNMAETAGESKDSRGRDIGRMFKTQDEVLRGFKLTEPHSLYQPTYEDVPDDTWLSDDDSVDSIQQCPTCHATLPSFAIAAHTRYHELD